MTATGHQGPVPLRRKRARRRTDAPAKHLVRVVSILVTLLCDEVLDYAACVRRYEISKRVFQRDLRKLREIGREQGFSISPITNGRVFLTASDRRAERLSAHGREMTDLLGRIAAALGGPIQHELRDAVGERAADSRSGFLHLRGAQPHEGDRVFGVFRFLKDAAAGPACVEFSYTPAARARAQRHVEPYHVVARAGRYYLVGYDLRRRDWRHFALDAISGPMRKTGTFKRRPVPDRFLAERAVGWIGGSAGVEVTVRFRARVAAAARARIWQQGQRIVDLPDGGVEISLIVDDLGEVVRWALGFGSQAVVAAPPEAVAFARELIEDVARAYAGAAPETERLTG
ncbi:MAG TPA: WYL domain-containing protein [Candidatus Acidoferrales bacterium]|nr:WYL domain-containing protein [Candidatus Acidoferrales bacterium]